MCRILLFIFLATALHAEDTKKKTAPSKASLNQLNSYNKELTEKIATLIGSSLDLQKPSLNQDDKESLQKVLTSHPEYIFELAIFIKPEFVSKILPGPEKGKINFDKKDFYTALLRLFLTEKHDQILETRLHQITWLAGNNKDHLQSHIAHFQKILSTQITPPWQTRLNYTLSLLFEAQGKHDESLRAILTASKTKDSSLRDLIRRQLLIAVSRTNKFQIYGDFIEQSYDAKAGNFQKFEELHDKFCVELLNGKDNNQLVNQLIKLQPNYQARLNQIKILAGFHNPKTAPTITQDISLLLRLKKYTQAEQLIAKEKDTFMQSILLLQLTQERDGSIKPELITRARDLAKSNAQKLQLFQWQIAYHIYSPTIWEDLRYLALTSENIQERYSAFLTSSGQTHAARLFVMLPKIISRSKLHDILSLMVFSSSEQGFIAYTSLLQREFKFSPAELSLVVSECSSLALQKAMPNAASVILRLIDEKNHNIQQVMVSSMALIQKEDFMGAAHNGLLRQNLRVPALMEMATHSLNKSKKVDKAKKSADISYSYYTSVKSLLAITAYFEQNHLPEISQSIYAQIQTRPTMFNKELLSLLNAASKNYLSQENYRGWMKISGLYLGYTLLHPESAYTPMQSLKLRTDLLRHRLLHAIQDDNFALAQTTVKKWLNEFKDDIEPVIILQKFCADKPAYNKLLTEAFEKPWAILYQHVQAHPDAVSQLNMLAWMGASCNRKINEALRYAKHAYKIQPQPAYLDTLAQCLYVSGDTKQATTFLKQCIILDPTNFYYTNKLALWQADSPGKNE